MYMYTIINLQKVDKGIHHIHACLYNFKTHVHVHVLSLSTRTLMHSMYSIVYNSITLHMYGSYMYMYMRVSK